MIVSLQLPTQGVYSAIFNDSVVFVMLSLHRYNIEQKSDDNVALSLPNLSGLRVSETLFATTREDRLQSVARTRVER